MVRSIANTTCDFPIRSTSSFLDDSCMHLRGGGGGGGGVQPKLLGKLGLEIGVYRKDPPLGRTFGEASESLRLLRSARRPRP